MPSPITNLRQAELNALQKHGRITKEGAGEIIKAAKADGTVTKEEKQVLADMLANDAFEKGAAAIIKAEAAKPVEKTSGLAGEKLGTARVNGKEMEVVVSKELGDNGGYDNKYQAIGAARANAGERPSAIIQTKDGKWHAVQTNMLASANFTPAKSDFKEVKGLFSGSPKAYVDLQKTASKALRDWQADPTNDTKRTAAEKAYVKLATEAWGVHIDDIKVIRTTKDMDPTKLNLMLETPHGQAYFGNAAGSADQLRAEDKHHTEKDGRAPHGMVFGHMTFQTYEHANGVLMHEATHKAHFDLADKMLVEWKGLWKDGKKPPPDFATWMGKQMHSGRVTREEHDAIVEQRGAGDMHGKQFTEIGSSLNEWFSTFATTPVGAVDATKPLLDVESYTHMGKDAEGLLTKRFDDFYTTLDEAHRTKFDEFMKAQPADSIMGRYEKASTRERHDPSKD